MSEQRPRSRSPRVILPVRQRALGRHGSAASCASTEIDNLSDISLEFFGVPDQDGVGPDDRMNGSVMGPMPDDEMRQSRTPRVVRSVPDVLARSPTVGAIGATGLAAGLTVCGDFRSALTARADAEHGPVSFARCVRYGEFIGNIHAHCRRFIDSLSETFFYIGITENPGRRFAEHEITGNWSQMHVLLEAVTSATTGAMEAELLEHYLRSHRCLNVGRGSERRSGGTPHYLYVIVNMTTAPLIRRHR